MRFLLSHRPDYLRVRLAIGGGMSPGADAVLSCVPNSDVRPLLGGDFFLVYFGEMGSPDKTLVRIYKIQDSNRNVLGQIRWQLFGDDARGSYIDLAGTWCRYYWQHTARLLAFFGVNFEHRSETVDWVERLVSRRGDNRILRFDYCFDFAARFDKVFRLFDPAKMRDWVVPVRKVDGRLTYYRKPSKRFDFVFYDKKLDILDNGFAKIRPSHLGIVPLWDYSALVRIGAPVTRFELRINSAFFAEESFSVGDLLSDPFALVRPRLEYAVANWKAFSRLLDSAALSPSGINEVLRISDFETSDLLERRKRAAVANFRAWTRKLAETHEFPDFLREFFDALKIQNVNGDSLSLPFKNRIVAETNAYFFPFDYAEDLWNPNE